MKKIKALMTASAVSLSTLLSTAWQIPNLEADAADTVNIMPIGDSITFGLGEDGGYRKYLDYALRSKNISFDMVGPEGKNSENFRYNGQSVQYDGNHAGYSGYTIKQQYPIPDWGENGLLEKLQKNDAIKKAQPDIVLLIIGTNDMTANRNLNDCEKDLHSLIDYILGDMPEDGVIFMGSIPEFTAYGGNAQRVGNYNNTVQKVAESYGDNVQFADVHGSLNGMADMSYDNLHPSGAGYEKMGKFWAEVIEEYLAGSGGQGGDTPDVPDSPEILGSDFESGLSGWEARGSASVEVSKTEAASGSASAFVSGRTASWNGIAYSLSSKRCPAGTDISVSAKVKQTTGSTVHFKVTMQYEDGTTVYDTFAEADVPSDKWVTISVPSYKMPDGSSPVLYIETDTDLCDFYLDDVVVMKSDGTVPAEAFKSGDADHSGTVDIDDASKLSDYLLGKGTEIYADTADIDSDGQLDVFDLAMLRQMLQDNSEQSSEGSHNKEYMSTIRSLMTTNVPSSALAKAEGTVEHITYFSKKANREKGANVWLPPSYDKSKKYPVLYVNHGYGGDESAMLDGMGVREIASNLIKSGEAEPMIIVFTNQYTNAARAYATGNGSEDVPYYDAFAEDLPDSLMPYIESHYPVKTGRENTAVAGFSMGGRESLYIGMMCKDKVGYIGAGAPAPGIFPTKDQFMDHPGCMSKDDIRIDAPYEPYILMIAGGTSDNMVGTYPEQYHDLFTEHGTDNIFIPVPGGGHDSSTVIPLMYNFIRFLFKA